MYRRLYFGGAFGALGGQATFVATAFQLREITHSALAVGALGLVELFPLIIAGLYGGVMADRFDRRKIIIGTEATFMLAALGLMFNALSSHPHAWVIYFLDAFIISSVSIQSPSWSALNQSLVRHEHQSASAVLGSIKMALVATLLSGWTKKVHFYGRALVASAILWGLGIAAFGFSSQLWLCFVALAFAGGADAMSAVFRQTHWNQSIPPEMRGRMGGIELLSYAIGPMTGSFRAGAMTTWTSLRFSLTFGGLGCAGAVGSVALALPALWNFDVRTNENVALVKQIRSDEEHLEP